MAAMAPPRRPGRSGSRGSSFAPPELRGAIGALLRTTFAQASAVREALERGAREGRARIDDARGERRRVEALAELGELVLGLVRRGKLPELEEIPAIADAIAAVEELESRDHRRRDRDDEPGRDWIAPESRSRFDRGRAASREEDAPWEAVEDEEEPPRRPMRRASPSDGTVSSSSGWTPPAPSQPRARVWGREAEEPAPARPRSRGGITFTDEPASPDDPGDEDDLAEYMNPADVPPRPRK
jgi:hypothetical protein